MDRGYVKLWRCSVDNGMYFSQPFTDWQAWQDIIIEAKWTPTTIKIRGMRLDVDRGFCSRSEVHLAKRWRWSRGKVSRFLRFLEQQNMVEIVQQKNRLTTLIKIINYDLYQPNSTTEITETGQQTDSRRTANSTTNKNSKEVITLKKEDNTKESAVFVLPSFLDGKIWEDFLTMRKAIRKPATQRAMELIVERLTKLQKDGNDPNEVLNQSIINSWAGVFPLKNSIKGKPREDVV